MNVLLISSSSSSRGGGELYLKVLADGLNKRGHNVRLAVSTSTDMDAFVELMSPLAEIIRIPYRSTYSRRLRSIAASVAYPTQYKWLQLLKNTAADFIHLNKQNYEDCLDILQSIRRSNRPSATTIHVTKPMQELGARFSMLRDATARIVLTTTSPHLIGTSQACVEQIKRFLPNHPTEKIHTIPNGAFGGSSLCRDQARKNWNVSEDQFVIGLAGRIEHQKNPLLIPRLLSRLPSHICAVWLGDGSLRNALEAEARTLKVEKRLFISGWTSNAREQMVGFDIFLLPSFYEGFPFALLESKWFGLPAVASHVDGVQDAVADGVSGVLCSPCNIEAWEKSVRLLSENANLRHQMSRAAAEEYRLKYTPEIMAGCTESVYKEIIATQERRRRIHF